MARLRILQIDVPEAELDRAVDFWAAALSAEPHAAPGGFVHLDQATSAVEVHVQPVGDTAGRYHLDLEASDREVEVERLTAAGAMVVRRDEQDTYTVMADPVGLPFCVIDPDAAERNTLASRRPDRGFLSGVFIDVPASAVERELGFWSAALEARVEATSRPETYTSLEGVVGPGGPVLVEVQRVGPGTAPRHHVDLEANDVAAEAARLQQLGAEPVAAIESWRVLRAPSQHLLCVVPMVTASEEGP